MTATALLKACYGEPASQPELPWNVTLELLLNHRSVLAYLPDA